MLKQEHNFLIACETGEKKENLPHVILANSTNTISFFLSTSFPHMCKKCLSHYVQHRIAYLIHGPFYRGRGFQYEKIHFLPLFWEWILYKRVSSAQNGLCQKFIAEKENVVIIYTQKCGSDFAIA